MSCSAPAGQAQSHRVHPERPLARQTLERLGVGAAGPLVVKDRARPGVGQVREANALELAGVVTATYTDAQPGAPGPPRPAPVLL